MVNSWVKNGRICLILLPALMVGCASPPTPKQQSYAEMVTNRPQPQNEEARMRECVWLKFEIHRQQSGLSYAVTLAPGSPKRKEVMAAVLKDIGVLEERALKVGCGIPGVTPPALPVQPAP